MSPEFFMLAKENHIQFGEAMRVGLSLMFAERGIADYDNRLNLVRKMTLFQNKTEELSRECEELREKLRQLGHG